MSLERIEITPFAVIVGDLLQERRTGYLTIIRSPLRKVLYWTQGELVLITSSAPEDSLGDFLVRRGIVTADRASQMLSDDPTNAVAKFHEAGLLELAWRQTLLREWADGRPYTSCWNDGPPCGPGCTITIGTAVMAASRDVRPSAVWSRRTIS